MAGGIFGKWGGMAHDKATQPRKQRVRGKEKKGKRGSRRGLIGVKSGDWPVHALCPMRWELNPGRTTPR